MKPPSSLIRTWSTDAETPDRRLDYWVGAICEGFLEMSVTSPAAATFQSSLESAPLGPLSINRVTGSAQHVYRTQHAINRARTNYYYLLCKEDAPWTAAQNGRTAYLNAGDAVLIDSATPYEFHFPVSADTVSLQMSRSWVETWLADPAAIAGVKLDGAAGWGRALSGFIREMSPSLVLDLPLPPQVMSDQLGALLALAARAQTGADAVQSKALASIKDRVTGAIAARYTEPGLTAAAIARGLGISERTLHRGLTNAGVTFAGVLMKHRMAAALRMLNESRFDRHSVAGIGLRAGFTDPSHFVRQFRRQMGLTPGAARRGRGEKLA